MSKFHLSIFILSSFLIINVFLSSTILEKYGHISSTNGKVIFDSKEFSEGEKMFFKIKANKECQSPLYYEYYSNINDINLASNSFPIYSVFSKVTETTSIQNKVTSSIKYYTIEKKFEEQKSKGDYLLLVVDCGYGVFDFTNTEKDESSKVIIIILVAIVIIVVICFCFCKKMARLRLRRYAPQHIYTNINGTYQNGQIYPPQVNSYVYPQEMRMVYNNPNGVPYNNNPNIQYYNASNMNMPNATTGINPAPAPNVVNNLITSNNISHQSYNLIPQSSTEQRYNDDKDSYKKPKF